MKLYRIVVLVILAAFLAAACGPAESESQELNLYAWSEYVPQALLDTFTAETDIKVNYDAYSSNEELMAKLQAGASGYEVARWQPRKKPGAAQRVHQDRLFQFIHRV